ncbi:MAG TPA: hypothetical protein VFO59_01010, partial [Dehalococcoidia bacterium]|nr:hypothetical protein [Dehalococcoidia bacterium]
TEKEESAKLRRFLDRDPGAEPPEDQELLRMAQLLEAGAPDTEENASRQRVWAKVSQEIAPAPPKARRWPWWPASSLALSSVAVAVAVAIVGIGVYVMSSSSSTASAEEIARKAQAVAVDPSKGGVQRYEMNLRNLADEQVSETHIWHQTPNLWRFESPGLLTVGDGDTIWEYSQRDNAVRISSGELSGPEPSATGLDALIGERISEGNHPVRLGDETVSERPAYVISLTVPKGSLTIAVDKETYFVLRSVLRTGDGATYSTEATFVRYNLDFAVPDPVTMSQGSFFTFVPPEGATVQDLRVGEPGSLPTPPPGRLPTVQPSGQDTSGWQIYRDEDHGFELRYPTDGILQAETEQSARIDLTFDAASNLSEKYVLIDAGDACADAFDGEPLDSGWVEANGVAFWREVRSGVAAGNRYDSVTYTASKGGACVSLSFVLHSVNPGNFPSPVPTFRAEEEARIFDDIVSTFEWVP